MSFRSLFQDASDAMDNVHQSGSAQDPGTPDLSALGSSGPTLRAPAPIEFPLLWAPCILDPGMRAVWSHTYTCPHTYKHLCTCTATHTRTHAALFPPAGLSEEEDPEGLGQIRGEGCE